jgi:hypothetical protein
MVETRKWLWKWRHVPSQTTRYFAFLGENMRKHMIFWGEREPIEIYGKYRHICGEHVFVHHIWGKPIEDGTVFPIFLVMIYYKKVGNDQTISNKHFSKYSKSWIIITHKKHTHKDVENLWSNWRDQFTECGTHI